MHELNDEERDMLAEVGNIGASHASTALSQLIGHHVEISVPSAKIVKIKEIEKKLDYEGSSSVGLYVPISGDVEGGILLAMAQESAFILADMMMGREIGESDSLDEMSESSLKELGNILVGNSLTALSTFLGMELQEHVPEIAKSDDKSLLDSIGIDFMEDIDSALEIKELMQVGTEMSAEVNEEIEVSTDFFMLFGTEDTEKFMEALQNKVG